MAIGVYTNKVQLVGSEWLLTILVTRETDEGETTENILYWEQTFNEEPQIEGKDFV